MLKRKNAIMTGLAIMSLSLAAWAASLKNESVGGIRLYDKSSKVTGKYGPPDKKIKGEMEAATGCVIWTCNYRKQGLTFEICASEDTNKMTVRSVRASGKSKAKTGKGIGLGSTRSAVKKVYGNLALKDSGVEAVEDEENRRALYFTFKGGKVVEIFFSEMPE
jgi:hypothetical protein